MNISALLGVGLEKEYPFSKRELLEYANYVGFTSNCVVGLNYKESLERFKVTYLVKDIANHYFPQLTQTIRELRGRDGHNTHRKMDENTRNLSALTIISESKTTRTIDNLFGYALVLYGTKV